MRERYRVIVDGEPSEYSWELLDKAADEAARAGKERPGAEIRIRRPDILVQRGGER